MINKEALEYLVRTGEEKEPIIQLPQGAFSTVNLSRVKNPTAKSLRVGSLTSVVDYIKTNIDKITTEILVHVESHREIYVYGPLNEDRDRECYLIVEARLPNNIRYDQFIDAENFNIMLQSAFVDIADKGILLKYTGLIKDEAVKTTGDDGVSQQVTVKTGVATVGQAIVPNPVVLAPYRTFLEIEQPTSKFIFRMKEGPRAALFEADGGAWKNKAISSIKEYLQEELKELDKVKIIA